MHIFAICIVKNEADIIKYNFEKASQWADKIFIIDNGSTDGTWKLIQSLKSDIITPWKQDLRPYRESMRGEIFNHFRHLAKKGDWWCFKLDADEIYADDPRAFLAAVPNKYHVVYSDQIEYYLTKEEVAIYEYENDFEKDRDKINYYLPYTWSELVFFKYRPHLQWKINKDMPGPLGLNYPKKIKVQHFKYRSPQQIKKRLATRNENTELGFTEWDIKPENWKYLLKSQNDMIHDTKNGAWHFKGCRNTHYQERWHIYWAKRVLFGLGIWR